MGYCVMYYGILWEATAYYGILWCLLCDVLWDTTVQVQYTTGYYSASAVYYGVLWGTTVKVQGTTEKVQCTTRCYLKGGLVYQAMPTI
jgi:hypothetical protein